jgi:hypothetical protein
MLRNIHTIIFFSLSVISLMLLILNYQHSVKIRNLNEIVRKNNEISWIKINAKNRENKKNDNNQVLFNNQEEKISRDFFRYKCKNRKRIGGLSHYVSSVPHDLYRVEGNISLSLE